MASARAFGLDVALLFIGLLLASVIGTDTVGTTATNPDPQSIETYAQKGLSIHKSQPYYGELLRVLQTPLPGKHFMHSVEQARLLRLSNAKLQAELNSRVTWIMAEYSLEYWDRLADILHYYYSDYPHRNIPDPNAWRLPHEKEFITPRLLNSYMSARGLIKTESSWLPPGSGTTPQLHMPSTALDFGMSSRKLGIIGPSEIPISTSLRPPRPPIQISFSSHNVVTNPTPAIPPPSTSFDPGRLEVLPETSTLLDDNVSGSSKKFTTEPCSDPDDKSEEYHSLSSSGSLDISLDGLLESVVQHVPVDHDELDMFLSFSSEVSFSESDFDYGLEQLYTESQDAEPPAADHHHLPPPYFTDNKVDLLLENSAPEVHHTRFQDNHIDPGSDGPVPTQSEENRHTDVDDDGPRFAQSEDKHHVDPADAGPVLPQSENNHQIDPVDDDGPVPDLQSNDADANPNSEPPIFSEVVPPEPPSDGRHAAPVNYPAPEMIVRRHFAHPNCDPRLVSVSSVDGQPLTATLIRSDLNGFPGPEALDYQWSTEIGILLGVFGVLTLSVALLLLMEMQVLPISLDNLIIEPREFQYTLKNGIKIHVHSGIPERPYDQS